MDFLANVALGLETALEPANLVYCLIGVVLGTLVGVLPGIGTITAMTILFPITFYIEPTSALIMLAGIWYGTGYGGRTASILLNLPGSPAHAVTCLDGFPLTRQGRGGVALFMTTMASFAGGTFGVLVMMFLTPTIAGYALSFSSAEYFSLMVLGLVAASTISEGSAIKSLSMVILGIMFGTVGTDIYTGTQRFTFGFFNLDDGISLVAIAMGIFGLTEVMMSADGNAGTVAKADLSMGAMLPTRDDVRRSWLPTLRGSTIGAFFGTLPGTGPTIASFISYSLEKRIAKDPSRFGNGAIEGIMAPESADNSAEQTAFIPTLALGIPGSATMAIMLGVLMIHGITPGPKLITQQPSLFWGLVMSFWIGNVLLVILNVPLIGMWVRLLTVPYRVLCPSVLMFVCIGTYSVANSAFDVWLVVFFAILGFVMRVLAFPATPLLLGFVLGPMMEEHFRRAMLLSRGDFMTFLERPISGTVIALVVLVLAWSIWSTFRRRGTLAPAQSSG